MKDRTEYPVNMTQHEVADFFRVDVGSIKRWKKKDGFPSGTYITSRTLLFDRDEIFQWMDSMKDKEYGVEEA
jgi:predicted DNA-binding transcriptional regulator AlpA